jgi:hypothetical protein
VLAWHSPAHVHVVELLVDQILRNLKPPLLLWALALFNGL